MPGLLLLAAAVIYAALQVQPWFDDLLITLSYSQNLASSNGMVFQHGSRVLGVTTVLWCWLNAAGFWLIPNSLHSTLPCSILFTFALFAAGISIARVSIRSGWQSGAWAAALFFVLRSDQTWLFGSETALAVALACEGLLAWRAGCNWLCGILMACLVLTRPEALVLVFLTGSVQLIVSRDPKPLLKVVGSFLLLVLPVLLILQWYFGSPIPNTFAAKRAQLSAGLFEPVALGSVKQLWAWICEYPAIAVIAFVLGPIHLLRAGRAHGLRLQLAALLLICWPLFHLAALSAVGIPYYKWYDYPLWLSQCLLLGAGCQFLVNAATEYANRKHRPPLLARRFAVGVCLLLVLFSTGPKWYGDAPRNQRERFEGYEKFAYVINSIGKAGDLVLAQEIGTLRFFLSPSIRIADAFYLTEHLPPNGELISPVNLLASLQPRFWVDSHAGYQKIMVADAQQKSQAMRKGFELWVPGPGRTGLKYTAREVLTDHYGVRILYEKSTPEPVPY